MFSLKGLCGILIITIQGLFSLRIQYSASSERTLISNENSNFTFLNVTRHDDGILYLAYYFPQWHFIPENRIAGKYYTDWDWIKETPHSFTPLSYYEMTEDTLAKHDDMAHEYRVGGFIFWHYWINNGMTMNHPVELFMHKTRKTKFMLSWDNDVETDILQGGLGPTKFDQPERHAYQLLRYFLNENYLTDKDGRKPFAIYLTRVPEDYLHRFTSFLKLYNVRLKIGFNWQVYQNNWAIPKNSEMCVEFGPHSQPLYGGYRVQKNSCADHWQGTLTSWDTRPRGCSGRSRHSCSPNIDANHRPSADVFKQKIRTIKSNIQPNNQDRIITVDGWNEWSEGAVLECSVEYACDFLKALR